MQTSVFQQLNWESAKKLLDTAYCYKPGLCEVPEGLPELHVQVLCDAFKLSASQLWIDDVLSWCEEGEGGHAWKRMDGFKHKSEKVQQDAPL